MWWPVQCVVECVVQAIEHFTIDGHWVPRELYFTYHLKLRKVFGPCSVTTALILGV